MIPCQWATSAGCISRCLQGSSTCEGVTKCRPLVWSPWRGTGEIDERKAVYCMVHAGKSLAGSKTEDRRTESGKIQPIAYLQAAAE